MSKQHTLGPWRFDGDYIYSDCTSSHESGAIAVVIMANDDCEANARVISSAPELLQALRKAQAVLNPVSGFTKRGTQKQERYLEQVRGTIRAAITKATGVSC